MSNEKNTALQKYKVIDGGLWIPKEELERLSVAFKEVHDSLPFMINREGHRRISLMYKQLADKVLTECPYCQSKYGNGLEQKRCKG